MKQDLIGVLDQTIVLLQQQREDELKELLAPLHPADIAELLEELEDDQRGTVLQYVSAVKVAETIVELEPEDQAAILESMGTERAGEVLEEMAADDVADLMGELSPKQAGALMQLLDVEDATDVRELLGFRPDTAGGIMTTEFVALHAAQTAQQAIDELRRVAHEVETFYYVYVLNGHEQLVGVLSLRELIIAPPETVVETIMRTQVVAVGVHEDQEEVARLVKKYNLLAVPVVDHENVLRGIVTVDDVLDVLEEEATEDIYQVGAVSEHEPDADDAGVLNSVRARLPWLMGLLFLSLVSGMVIERFTGLLVTVSALSIFITTMAGGSGNAATQALTVMVRNMATGDFDRSMMWSVLWREVRVGMVMGAACGAALAITATIWHGSPWIGLIAGSAIFVNLTLAKGAGTLVPVIIDRLGFDPAAASAPFIATVTDTTSMLIYFGIASAVVHYVAGL